MNFHYKIPWNETTGEDITNNWGTSIFYIETNEELRTIRQIQVFQNGAILKYSLAFPFDEFSMLSDQELDNLEYREYTISEAEFTVAWDDLKRTIL